MRKLILVLALAFIIALLLTACGGDGGSDDEPVAISAGDAVVGKDLYLVCAGCHGTDGAGLPNNGKDLTTSEFIKGLTDEEFVEYIKTGRPISDPLNTTGVDMPPKGGNPAFTDEDLLNVVAYVRTIVE